MVQWIEEPCGDCRNPVGGSPEAIAFYGSGVMPPTTKPPWLHDSGGVGPGIIAGAPDEVGVGAYGQFSGETWQFRFYGPDGYLMYSMPGYRAMTFQQGVATLQQAYMNNRPRGVAKVCAVVRSAYGGARICYTDAGYRTESNSPTWNGTRGCRPGTALDASGRCIFRVPHQPLMGPGGFIGQTCDEIQAHINELQNARAQLGKDLENASAGYNAAVKAYSALVAAGQDASAAGDAVNTASAQVADIKTNIQNIDAEIAKSKAELANCQAAGPTPTPTGCQNDHPDCGAAGFICVNGECVPGCRSSADCGPGWNCVNGQCVQQVTKAGMGGGWALALLALAAVGAIFFGARPGGGPVGLEDLE